MLLVVAKLPEDRGQLHRTFQRLEDLLHLEVALGGGEAGLLLFPQVARLDKAGGLLFALAPFRLAPIGRLRIAGNQQLGVVALVPRRRSARRVPGLWAAGSGGKVGKDN